MGLEEPVECHEAETVGAGGGKSVIRRLESVEVPSVSGKGA